MNRFQTRIYILVTLLIFPVFAQAQFDKMDLQGHRGYRGHFPENTIKGFEEAIRLGVTTLEMDVVLSGENTWFVSHEPWLNHEICRDMQGRDIDPLLENTFNLYWLTDEEIRGCDCGSKGNPRFPEQRPMPAFKPTLAEVFRHSEEIAATLGRTIRYNIEIKSQPDWYGIHQPEPEEYVDFFTDFMDGIDFLDRITIQSFDMKILQLLHEQRPEWTLALLVDNGLTVKQNIKLLGFVPHIYSPRFTYAHKLAVKACRDLGMKIIPWTVNEPDDMKKLLELGVDGIITDYPDRLLEILK